MLKRDEKIIFSIKSGFSLNGLNDYKLEDKCLQFTNLGNIYISKVDCLAEECSDFIMYDFDAHGISLYSEIDKESINVVSDYIPFTVCKNGIEKSVDLSVLIVLDFEEFSAIDNQIENMIFDFKQGDTIMILDGRYAYSGKFTGGDENILFATENFNFNFNFNDVEDFSEEYNRIKFNGYFYINEKLNIVRKVSFVGNLSNYKLPLGFELKVESNNKIGFLPFEDRMVVCKITGKIANRVYDSKEMFLIKHNEMYIFYDKAKKKEIFSRKISNYSKYFLGNDEYIIFDEENVFKMEIGAKSLHRVLLNKLAIITNKNIGYTDSGNPFFISLNEETIKISNSKSDSVLEIEKDLISDITVDEEESIENGDLVSTEIKFADRKIKVNLKRSLITEMTENVFSDYQISIFENASIEEVYENWVKTVSDMVVYNVFGEVYQLCYRFLKPYSFEEDIAECIEFINKYYEEIEEEKKKIDNITVHLSGILEKNELNYFRSMGIKSDLECMEKIRKIFLEIRSSMNYDLNEVINKFNTVNYLIMPKSMIEEFCERLSGHDMYIIKYFAKQGKKSLEHFIRDLLPFYVEKVIVTVFEVYMDLYGEYSKLEEKELKYELMNRIKSAHVFKQFTVESGSSILRKEVVDDLYSLVKFSSMRIDSEFYYTGGYN